MRQQYDRDGHRLVAVPALDLAEYVKWGVLVDIGRFPATITTLPNSPSARLNERLAPVRIAA